MSTKGVSSMKSYVYSHYLNWHIPCVQKPSGGTDLIFGLRLHLLFTLSSKMCILSSEERFIRLGKIAATLQTKTAFIEASLAKVYPQSGAILTTYSIRFQKKLKPVFLTLFSQTYNTFFLPWLPLSLCYPLA